MLLGVIVAGIADKPELNEPQRRFDDDMPTLIRALANDEIVGIVYTAHYERYVQPSARRLYSRRCTECDSLCTGRL